MDNPFKPSPGYQFPTNRNKPAHNPKNKRWRVVVIQALFAVALLTTIFLLPSLSEWLSYRIARGRVRATHETLDAFSPTSFGNTSRLVAEAISSSVVNITTQNSMQPQQRLIGGQGSGVIVGSDGYILTNYHVIQDAENCLVTLHDNQQLPAILIGADPNTDIAVLKIKKSLLHPATWGDSGTLAAGDPVWAIGSPYGLENSVSFGIVSATSRDGIGRGGYDDLLQTDAALNPGNSGGPLVNAQGHLIGINMAIVGPSHRGISFAIPSNKARIIFEQIKSKGITQRGWLGVQLHAVPQEILAQYELSSGVLLTAILPKSPAEESDLKRGDIVLQWDGHAVDTPSDFSKRVMTTQPRTVISVDISRNGKKLTVPVTVGQKPMVH